MAEIEGLGFVLDMLSLRTLVDFQWSAVFTFSMLCSKHLQFSSLNLLVPRRYSKEHKMICCEEFNGGTECVAECEQG